MRLSISTKRLARIVVFLPEDRCTPIIDSRCRSIALAEKIVAKIIINMLEITGDCVGHPCTAWQVV